MKQKQGIGNFTFEKGERGVKISLSRKECDRFLKWKKRKKASRLACVDREFLTTLPKRNQKPSPKKNVDVALAVFRRSFRKNYRIGKGQNQNGICTRIWIHKVSRGVAIQVGNIGGGGGRKAFIIT